MSDRSGLVVPWQELSPAALRGLLEELVTREGTEYGARDVPLEEKVRAVRRQLERGEAVVVWDPETETANVVLPRDLRC